MERNNDAISGEELSLIAVRSGRPIGSASLARPRGRPEIEERDWRIGEITCVTPSTRATPEMAPLPAAELARSSETERRRPRFQSLLRSELAARSV